MAQDRDEAIRARAHEIWEAEGRPHGRHEAHWAQAQAEMDGVDDGAPQGFPQAGAPAQAGRTGGQVHVVEERPRPMRTEQPGLAPAMAVREAGLVSAAVAAPGQTGAVIGGVDDPPRGVR